MVKPIENKYYNLTIFIINSLFCPYYDDTLRGRMNYILLIRDVGAAAVGRPQGSPLECVPAGEDKSSPLTFSEVKQKCLSRLKG